MPIRAPSFRHSERMFKLPKSGRSGLDDAAVWNVIQRDRHARSQRLEHLAVALGSREQSVGGPGVRAGRQPEVDLQSHGLKPYRHAGNAKRAARVDVACDHDGEMLDRDVHTGSHQPQRRVE